MEWKTTDSLGKALFGLACKNNAASGWDMKNVIIISLLFTTFIFLLELPFAISSLSSGPFEVNEWDVLPVKGC